MSRPSSEPLALQSPLVELECALEEGEGDLDSDGGRGATRVGEGRESVELEWD